MEPLKLRNYRDAAKYHCHLPGKYRKTAHNACNINLRIRPEESRRHKDKVYMDGWERFSETKLQHKKMFYSSLTDEHIMQTFGGLS